MATSNLHFDFSASGVDPVVFRAESAAAKQWLLDTGKAEADAPGEVRRDRASSLIFLDALTRRGFTCVDSSGAAMQPPVAHPNDGTASLIGCGSILAVAVGLGLFWAGIFDGDKPTPRPTHAAAGGQLPTPPAKTVPTITQVYEAWAKFEPREAKLVDEWRTAVNRFAQLHDDPPVDQITASMVRAYRRTCSGLPSRAKKKVPRSLC